MQKTRMDGTTAMQVFKFNVGSRSVERAVADAIGLGLAERHRIEDGVPQRLAELLARLADAEREQSRDLARLTSRKSPQD